MAIQRNGSAPYAPAATVIDLIERFRSHGLATPFTVEVLLRAGVTESLAPRTLQALRLLELVDAEGAPTPEFIGLQEAPTNEYRGKLAELVRGAYAEVFAFADPATDTPERIEDAFRGYEPKGQRGRMVTLFLGLCQAAGIVEEAQPRARTPKRPTPAPSRTAPVQRAARPKSPPAPVVAAPALSMQLPAAILALVNDLPERGAAWTEAERDTFMLAFRATVDIYYPSSSERRPRAQLLPGPQS